MSVRTAKSSSSSNSSSSAQATPSACTDLEKTWRGAGAAFYKNTADKALKQKLGDAEKAFKGCLAKNKTK